ncbi:MAG: hypothetical protein KDE27_26145 [Planctomycetes bacterium]|nr:hypothetical protein [Planctomycetota bacterium]
MRTCQLFFTTLLTLSSAPLTGQQLVADVAPGPAVPPLSSYPDNFVALPNVACFSASTAEGGSEPWVTDGTAAGTRRLRDLVPGMESSAPRLFCAVAGKILFAARLYAHLLPANGELLFCTDGTPQGTVITPVPVLPQPIRAVYPLSNGLLIDYHGVVYASDLTAAGSQPVPGMNWFTPQLEVGGVTYGTCITTTGDHEIWASDGTVAGSRLVVPGAQGHAPPRNFVAWNGRIYYHEFQNTCWLSSTDGIAGRTQHVQLAFAYPEHAERMFVRGGRLVSVFNGELLSSDATPAGTTTLALPCSDLGDLCEFGGRLFMRATSPATGYEMWTTDGTVAGTAIVADLAPGMADSNPSLPVETPNGIFCKGTDALGAPHLYQIFGPATMLDIGQLPSNSPVGYVASPRPSAPPTLFTPFLDGVLFAAETSTGQDIEPWFGSASRPAALLRDLDANGRSLRLGPNPVAVPVREQLLFGSTGSGGVGIYGTDGSTTQLVVPWGGFTQGAKLARFGDRIAYLTTNDVRLADRNGANVVALHSGLYSSLVQVQRDRIWFLDGSARLHVSDGTAAGTIPVTGAAGIAAFDYRVLPGWIALWNLQGTYGTDGVAAAQQLVPGAAGWIGVVDDRLVLLAPSGGGWALTSTDGTLAGTLALAFVPASNDPKAAVGGGLAFVSDGAAIWQTDGTLTGTAMIATIPPDMQLHRLLPTADALFVTAATPATGSELWRIDRTAGQIALVTELAPAEISGVGFAAPLGDGNLLFLSGGDETTGRELYVSDGTASGTRLLADIHPGPNSSNPELLGIADDAVYFLADDGVHGIEPWTMPLAASGAARLQPFGIGCPGAFGNPQLTPTAPPIPGTASFGFELDAVQAGTLVLFGLGTDDGQVALGSCDLLLGGNIASVFGVSSAGGSATLTLPLPAARRFIGLRFAVQAFALDTSTARGFAMSDGEIVIIGR